ncbi:hypothetical protein PG985_016284 [Apiospora marii]|uniref:Uncharacterized protein n=1 Tax=Apiospora marii TaxID=335849 RepID=A0ABR1STZ7_9PEZI
MASPFVNRPFLDPPPRPNGTSQGGPALPPPFGAWGGNTSSAVVSKQPPPPAPFTSPAPAVAALSRTAWLASHKPVPPSKNPFLFPPSSVVTPAQQRQRELPRAAENKAFTAYPDHYSPARDKVKLCRELRRNALSPRKLNGVLDCLEGVNRLQDQLVRARRELANLALFGTKYGREREPQRGRGDARGGSVSPKAAASALARSPAARRWKKLNKRRAAATANGGNGASRRTVQREQDRQRASPHIKLEDREHRDNAIRRAPLQDIAVPNRAVAQRMNWQK